MDSDINYIIQESLKGDNNYQEILLKRLTPLIFKNIYTYYMPSNPLTEDLLQEGYIVILQSLKDYDIKRNVHFLQYVKIKLYYFFKNYYRKDSKYNILSIENLSMMGKQLKSNDANQLNLIILTEEKDALYKCMSELSEEEQAILQLYYFERFSIQEISQELNIKYRKVINTKSKAVKKLRKCWQNYYSNN